MSILNRLVYLLVVMAASFFVHVAAVQGDCYGNGDEGVAGTDFADGDDFFKVSGVAVMSPASISFDSQAGREYALDRNDNLAASPQIWTEFTNGIPGTGAPIMINDPDDVTNRNYRVRVWVAP